MDIPLPPEAARAWLQDLFSASAGSFGMITRNFMSLPPWLENRHTIT